MEPRSAGLLAAKFRSRTEYCLRQADRSSDPVENKQWLLFATRWQRFAAEEEELDWQSNCGRPPRLNERSGASFQRLDAHTERQARAEATYAGE
jgi:hypothetical protein